ncbi:coenzyme F420 hydrogenase subunit delta [Methanomicrobium sp. W14]|uniref:coenzyme F420-reducing hydrogenase, FrhD protein n=1 Tax=Methanomicrobium sp. W14 TaxID=2817839 RepID=UPI001AE5BE9E|nr:coenzyme F420-reducing hydrogenase, FrhD protein [Methanomicrobium sp. W14]MBP2133571.1 coenzyme F420 hydrogenase subunit delta [Methanomicrobium sp. W14]
MYPEIVIAGCGNPLFADDGFGPAVIEELKRTVLPGNVKTIDAGLGGPELLFSLLDPKTTKKLIVIDIVDFCSVPGDITKFNLNEEFERKLKDAEPGGISSSLEMLKNKMDVHVIGCQPQKKGGLFMEIGLSKEVRKAVPRAVGMVFILVGIDFRSSCAFNRCTEVSED